MAGTTSKALQFLIGVKDNASSKMAKINKSVESMQKGVQGHFQAIGTSALAIAGVGYAINNLIAPAHEFDIAMG